MRRKKLKITDPVTQKEIVRLNFDPQVYEDAIEPIKEAIAQSKVVFGLYRRIENLEYAGKCECPDIEYGDDITIMRCSVELDKNRLQTSADYVAVYLHIGWDDEAKY